MGYMDDRKWVHKKEEFPNTEHFVIIEFGTMLVADPYDDKNGHSYHESKINYIVFKDEQSWKAEIAKRTIDKADRNDWVATKVSKPASTKTTVEVIND
jgi:hypothetical protein